MKKRIKYLLFVVLLLIPVITNAHSFNVVSEETKYFRTITPYTDVSLCSVEDAFSLTTEISEEEYNNVDITDISLASSGYTETTYKKMTTSILSNGSYYRYKNRLVWKNMPKVRSYDIIGIGFLSTVRINGSAYFEQYYCPEYSSCVSSTSHNPQTFTNGAGTTFKLPSGTLTQLEQTYYFDVEKNTTATIISQAAYGDYSHATSSVSLTTGKKYIVGTNGIVLNSSVIDYYDSITKATANWSGSW